MLRNGADSACVPSFRTLSGRVRILLRDGDGDARDRLEQVLRLGGCKIAARGEPFDLLLTLGDAPPASIRRGELTIDLATATVARGDRPLRLSRIEFAIVAHLARSERPASRAELLAAIWGYRFDPGTNLLAVHVSRLRGKLGRAAIACCRLGYSLAGEGGAAGVARDAAPSGSP